jgi:hypothetical protein
MPLTSRIVLLLLSGLLISATLAQPPEASLAAWLRQQRWQKRVVLLCAPGSATPELTTQRQLLAAATADLQERDIVVREVLFDHLSAADRHYLTQELEVKTSGFTFLLIGKDGGVKRRETAPIKPASLFGTIDTMPMRRQEARRPR